MLAKKKMLGNIKFIGELGKLQMLHESILHSCIKQLLEKKKHSRENEVVEDMECLCQIMKTVGPALDTDKAKVWMDAYFQRMEYFMTQEDLPPRIRFLLKDIIELRRNKWVPRKSMKEVKPRTIQEVRDEAAKDLGLWVPKHGGQGGRMAPPTMNDMNLFGPPMMMNGRGGPLGMGDMFPGMSKGFMDTLDVSGGPPKSADKRNNGGLTAPYMDDFTASSPNYSANMGRPRGGGGSGNAGGPPQSYQVPQQSQWGGGGGNNHSNRDNDGYQQARGGGGGGGGRQDRDEYHHNNHHNYYNKQQQNSGMRDLPPRFKKLAQQSAPGGPPRSISPNNGSVGTNGTTHMTSNGNGNYTPAGLGNAGNHSGEISLRPGKTYTHQTPATTVFKPNTPSMLPKSAQVPVNSYTGQAPRPSMLHPSPDHNPLLQKQAQITIKHQTADHKTNKSAKKSGGSQNNSMSKEEFNNLRNTIFEKFVESRDIKNSVSAIKGMKPSKKNATNLMVYLLQQSLDKSKSLSDDFIKLVSSLIDEKIIAQESFMEALTTLLDRLPKLEISSSSAMSDLSCYMATAVSHDVAEWPQIVDLFTDGQHFPMFFIVLEKLVENKSPDYVQGLVTEHKIDLTKMMHEEQRQKEKTLEVLECRNLGFLMPLLRIQVDLWKHICNDPNPQNMKTWIKDNVEADMCSTTGFIHVLVTNILRYVVTETSLAEGIDTSVVPDKALQEKEKQLLEKYKGVLQSYLHERLDLQVNAIYALQVLCNTHNFPKGLMLRMFMQFYDMEIIDEEAFLKWKEELNDEFPGKGKALFQVHQWLTWLEQAEEESGEEEDEDDD